MGKRNKGKKEARVGSVAYNRAQGINKAAQNQAAKAAAPAPTPAPTRSPSPSPSPSPSQSTAQSSGGTTMSNPSAGSQRSVAKERAQMSVKDRRAAAKEAGMSMKEFKSGASSVPQKSMHTYKPGHSAENTTAYGKTMGEFMSLDDYKDSNWAALNPNMDKYKEGGERMSSKGLYQDRYNVGYHGDDDLGDEYASTSFQGSVNKTFDKFRSGEQNFFQAYQQYVGSGRDEGYAGDVLKLIDSGKLKVSDDQYNMVVTDAQNYDWDKRGEIAGRDSGDSYYDSRAGGRAGNQTDEAQQEYMKSIGHSAAGGFQNDYDQGTSNQYQQNQFQQQNNMNYDFSQFMPSQRQGQKFQSFQGYSGPTSFGAGMKFSFDPSKFMQGQ